MMYFINTHLVIILGLSPLKKVSELRYLPAHLCIARSIKLQQVIQNYFYDLRELEFLDTLYPRSYI